MGPAGTHIEANGLKIYYEAYGEGESLLLIHGGTATSQSWASHLPAFPEHLRVFAPDSRGHGRTDNPAGELGYRMMADDVAALIDVLGLRRPLVLGYSDGGQIALELGMRYPGLVRVLVLGGTPFRFSEAYLEATRALLSIAKGDEVDLEKLERYQPDFVNYLREAHGHVYGHVYGPEYWKTYVRQIASLWLTPLRYTSEDLATDLRTSIRPNERRDEMLLENKTAIVYGGSGSVGGAVARAFAREGATVFLAGRTLATLEEVAEEIRAAGGEAETAQVDALDEEVVEEHAKTVAEKAGGIDISFNAIFNDDVQGAPLAEMPFEDFSRPIMKAMRNQFLTARAVARHMVERGLGVILTITGGYREAFPTIGGTVVAWAAIEAQCRQWACELGPQAVRVVWLRTTGLPEAIPDTGDAAADLGTGYGEGMTREEIIAGMRELTILKRLASLDELGKVAAFMASDQAGAMTATFANITCGAILD